MISVEQGAWWEMSRIEITRNASRSDHTGTSSLGWA
jgi:hypothetical protein